MGSFLHPGIALSALGLISIPIIIHLLNRRRFRRIDWAAMEYLLRAMKKNRRRVRIEQLLLLLLRIVLMALIGLAMARPMLQDEGLEWLASAFRSEEKIFVLDDSASTTQQEAGRTVFDKATSALGRALRRTTQRSSGDRITILRSSRPRHPVVQGAFADRDRAEAWVTSVAEFSPTDTRLDLAEVFESIADTQARNEEDGGSRPRTISILSDLRSTDWTDGQGGAHEALTEVLGRLGGSEANPTRVVVVDLAGDGVENAAITQVELDGGNPLVNVPTALNVEIRNFGRSPVNGLGLRLHYRSLAEADPNSDIGLPPFTTTIGAELEELAPGASVTQSLPCTFRRTGHYGVVVEITGANDALLADNRYPFALEVVEFNEVLLVDGEPSSERVARETVFLEQALAPYGDVPSGIKPEVVVEDGVPQNELDRFAAVFLANVYTLPEATLQRVVDYVVRGGALIIFPGDQVDATLYNRQLATYKRAADDGVGTNDAGAPGNNAANNPSGGTDGSENATAAFLPARLGGVVRFEDEPAELMPSLDHRYFSYLRKAEGVLQSPRLRFESIFSLTPVAGGEVVARFSDVDNSPAIVEGRAGRGRVVLFATAADLEWSNWARNPTYLITVEKIVQDIVKSRAPVGAQLAGAPLEVPIDLAAFAQEAFLRVPERLGQPQRTVLAAPVETQGSGASYAVTVEDTQHAGLYTLGLRRRDGETEWRHLAVERDPAESNLQKISAAELVALYPQIELSVVTDADAFTPESGGRFEISDLLLWLFAAFLLLEGFLAWRFAHHRRDGGGAAA